MKEIVILEAFAGLLKGRIPWDAHSKEIRIPMPRPIGYSYFSENSTSDEPIYKVGVFKRSGKTDDEGMKIFILEEIV